MVFIEEVSSADELAHDTMSCEVVAVGGSVEVSIEKVQRECIVEYVSTDRTDQDRIFHGVDLSGGLVLKHPVSMLLHDSLAVSRRVCVNRIGRLRLNVIVDKLFIGIFSDIKFILVVVGDAIVSTLCIEGYHNSVQHRRLAKA